jgi:hypothetical protein
MQRQRRVDGAQVTRVAGDHGMGAVACAQCHRYVDHIRGASDRAPGEGGYYYNRFQLIRSLVIDKEGIDRAVDILDRAMTMAQARSGITA